MAAPRLNIEQRQQLRACLAAEYSEPLIRQWCEVRGWPVLNGSTLTYYRRRDAAAIAVLRRERQAHALAAGLALKEERFTRLAEHADELEAIKWEADERVRLWNEKAWRETLDAIAREVGDRRASGAAFQQAITWALDRLAAALTPDEYGRALIAIAGE